MGDTASCCSVDPRPVDGCLRSSSCLRRDADEAAELAEVGSGAEEPPGLWWVVVLPWNGVAVEAEVEEDVGASGEVGRTDPGSRRNCFVLVVVPVFGSTADEGEALSTAARPAQPCSPIGRAGDTLAG